MNDSEIAGKADCGCVYHAEEGIPCKHDLALTEESVEFVMLLQDHMLPVPEGVEIKTSWERVIIRHDEGITSGEHVVITGSESVVKNWLGQYDGFWKGVGSPMLQEFEIYHIAQS